MPFRVNSSLRQKSKSHVLSIVAIAHFFVNKIGAAITTFFDKKTVSGYKKKSCFTIKRWRRKMPKMTSEGVSRMEAPRKVLVTKVGSDYTPPAIREVPTIADGRATVHFRSPLSEGQRKSLATCFRNFCTRFQVSPRMVIRDQAAVIGDAPEEILRQALRFLEIDIVPEPRTPATVKPRQAQARSRTSKQRHHGTGLSMKSQLARV